MNLHVPTTPLNLPAPPLAKDDPVAAYRTVQPSQSRPDLFPSFPPTALASTPGDDRLSVLTRLSVELSGTHSEDEIRTRFAALLPAVLQSDALALLDGGAWRWLQTCSALPAEMSPNKLLETLAENGAPVCASARARSGSVSLSTRQSMHLLVTPIPWNSERLTPLLAIRVGDAAFDVTSALVTELAAGIAQRVFQAASAARLVDESAIETVRALARVIEARDPYTRGHSERVGWLAQQLGRKIGLSEGILRDLHWAGLLHDIGKIGVPEAVLNKPGPLTDADRALIRNHPQLSYEMIRPVRALAAILPAVRFHHEDYNGGGYPVGLCGEAIPLGARILRIADSFDALTSTRSYRNRATIDQALAQIELGRGSAYDPQLAQAFVELVQARDGEFNRLFAPDRSAP